LILLGLWLIRMALTYFIRDDDGLLARNKPETWFITPIRVGACD